MFGIKWNRPGTSSRRCADGDSGGHHVRLQQVVKTYESTAGVFAALKGIDLQVKTGEFVAIIGKSGSGKSTLINMITGMDRPTAGQVFVGDTAVHALSEEQTAIWRGRTIGIVFQFFQLLPTLTAIENLMLPMDYGGCFASAERPERAMHLLEQVGMADDAHTLPSALSGGQQQRIAIARALANDPPVIVADEPTGNLDSRTAHEIFDLFSGLVDQGKTLLVVTHDKEIASRATRVIEMADGQIVTGNAQAAVSGGEDAALSTFKIVNE